MRADGDVGFFFFDELYKRLGIETVKGESALFILPGLIERFVDPS